MSEHVRPTGAPGPMTKRFWRHLDLVHNGRTFLRRRGFAYDRIGGVLLHRIDEADPSMGLHDHPWAFWTLVLRGGYTEDFATIVKRTEDHWIYCPGCGCTICSHRPDGCRWHPTCVAPGLTPIASRRWHRFSIHRMPLDVAHRITAAEPGTTTLVVRLRTMRLWGFYLPTGWVSWLDYDYRERRPVTEGRAS